MKKRYNMKISKLVCILLGAVSLIAIVSAAENITSGLETPVEPISPAADTVQTFAVDDTSYLRTDGYTPYAGQFPYHAEVGVKSTTSTFVDKRGGALITPSYVLMPAYFLYDKVNRNTMEYGVVVLGSLLDGNTQWEQRISFTKAGIAFHPFFQYPSDAYYNIAAIRLDRAATVNKYVQPIRLPKLSDFRTYDLMEGTATGAWNGAGLKYSRNQLMPLPDCQQQLTSIVVTAQHICTDAYRGASFCNRQVGSSLTIEDENGRVLVGLADYVYWCQAYTLPSRHVRISSFREWIQSNTDYKFEY